jgi:AMMECR1 domain-containing protein
LHKPHFVCLTSPNPLHRSRAVKFSKKAPLSNRRGAEVKNDEILTISAFINLTLNPSPQERDFKNRELNSPTPQESVLLPFLLWRKELGRTADAGLRFK